MRNFSFVALIALVLMVAGFAFEAKASDFKFSSVSAVETVFDGVNLKDNAACDSSAHPITISGYVKNSWGQGVGGKQVMISIDTGDPNGVLTVYQPVTMSKTGYFEAQPPNANYVYQVTVLNETPTPSNYWNIQPCDTAALTSLNFTI